jgi:hypothetical protein
MLNHVWRVFWQKAWFKYVAKVTTPGQYKVGEKLHIDISLVKTTTNGRSNFWFLIVDKKSNYCWTHFLKQKTDFARLMVNFVMSLATTGKAVKLFLVVMPGCWIKPTIIFSSHSSNYWVLVARTHFIFLKIDEDEDEAILTLPDDDLNDDLGILLDD